MAKDSERWHLYPGVTNSLLSHLNLRGSSTGSSSLQPAAGKPSPLWLVNLASSLRLVNLACYLWLVNLMHYLWLVNLAHYMWLVNLAHCLRLVNLAHCLQLVRQWTLEENL